jgi:hypothetical protein
MKIKTRGNSYKIGDFVINLDNVSNIIFLENKVIVNFNYFVSLQNDVDKHIPDYIYIYPNEEQRKKLESILIREGWIFSKSSDNPNRYVNPDCIAFIKREERTKVHRDGSREKKYRIIVNLNYTVSLNHDIYRKTSGAVYYDFTSYEEMEKNYNRFLKVLGTEVI